MKFKIELVNEKEMELEVNEYDMIRMEGDELIVNEYNLEHHFPKHNIIHYSIEVNEAEIRKQEDISSTKNTYQLINIQNESEKAKCGYIKRINDELITNKTHWVPKVALSGDFILEWFSKKEGIDWIF